MKPTLRYRRVLWLSYAAGGLSAALTTFALAWGSSRYGAAALGGTLLAGMLPGLVLNLVGGVLADRIEPRHALLAGAALNALVLLAMAAALALEPGPFVFVAGSLALSVLGSLLGSFDYVIPAALFPEGELVRVNAQLSLASDAAHLAGPLLGGLLFSVAGSAGVLVLAAVPTLAAGLLLLGLPPLPRNGGGETLDLAHAGAGFAYLVRSARILRPALFLAVANLFAAAFQVAAPLYAAGLGGVGAYALLTAAMNLGMTVSNLALVAAPLRSSEQLILAAALVQGLALVGLGRSRSLPGAAALGALNDAMANVSGTVFIAYLQARLPQDLLGRVFAAVNTVAMLLTPLGFAAAPWLIERVEPGAAIMALGTGTAAAAALLWFFRDVGGSGSEKDHS
ncbi:MFS transporter [Oceanithermus sp.]